MNARLIFTSSLVYLVGSDDKIAHGESHWMANVFSNIEGGRALITEAVALAKSLPVESFLSQIRGKLKPRQALFTLAHLMDAVVADGDADPVEMALFFRFAQAMNVSARGYKPILDVSKVMMDKSCLELDSGGQWSSPFVFTTAMVYMASIDQRVDPRELSAILKVLGRTAQSKALLEEAVSYKNTHSLQDLLDMVRKELTPRQRLFLLTHLAALAFSDGEVDEREKLFLDHICPLVGDSHLYDPFIEIITIKSDFSALGD